MERSAVLPDVDLEGLPETLDLELRVSDPRVIAELSQRRGTERDDYALTALRIGVMALQQARGQLDAAAVGTECDRMLAAIDAKLGQHAQTLNDRLAGALREYFDPQSGRFPERIKRFIERDGELETLLRRQLSADNSELSQTLATHVGQQSPLVKLLSPTDAQGFLSTLGSLLNRELTQQREGVLKEFSLDNPAGALTRLVQQIVVKHGELTGQLNQRIEAVVAEFSLDQENSALSRLVRNVEGAQRTISKEFSLDNDQSALSRMSRIVESTNQAIRHQLTLDDEQSALFRLKRELTELLKTHAESNLKFQDQVKMALVEMSAKRKEAERSTRHGLEFEAAVVDFVTQETHKAGDLPEATGATTGLVKNSKKGDAVVTLGPEHVFAGARIVIEAKQEVGYTLMRARAELEEAKKNRSASVGLFVFSRRTAPPELEPIARVAGDVFVVWDAEDANSDVLLKVALSLAKFLCVQPTRVAEDHQVDFDAIDKTIIDVQRRAANLEDVRKAADAIQTQVEKILERVRIDRRELDRCAGVLVQKVADLKKVLGANGAG